MTIILLYGFLDLDEMSDKASSEHGEEGEPGEQGSTKASSPGSSSSMPLPSMLLERKMETLTTEWNKSPDMLFTIHPTDGSFLVWHVKYLDEFNQGIFRQVQVSGELRTWKNIFMACSNFHKQVRNIFPNYYLFCCNSLLSNSELLTYFTYSTHTHSGSRVAVVKLVTQHSPSLI